MPQKKLILTYNAHSGIFSAATDFVKKITHPEKYDCHLCQITYGALKMQHPWKEYLSTLPYEKVFLYRDQFIARFPESDIAFPAILIQEDDETPSVILNATEINQANNLQQLIVRLSEKN